MGPRMSRQTGAQGAGPPMCFPSVIGACPEHAPQPDRGADPIPCRSGQSACALDERGVKDSVSYATAKSAPAFPAALLSSTTLVVAGARARGEVLDPSLMRVGGSTAYPAFFAHARPRFPCPTAALRRGGGRSG